MNRRLRIYRVRPRDAKMFAAWANDKGYAEVGMSPHVFFTETFYACKVQHESFDECEDGGQIPIFAWPSGKPA
jgi:hypothetical protein